MPALPEPLVDRLLARIGLAHRPAPDAEGLRTVHRAYVSRVPYEDLAVQLGECEPLDPERLAARVASGGRGGYCFEVNTVLMALLEGLGFSVERRQAIVTTFDGPRSGEQTNHLALLVTLDDGERTTCLAEAGWGEGPLDPLPFREGTFSAGPFTWGVEPYPGGGWWIRQHAWGSTPGFWLGDERATLADFQPHHERLSTSPDSSFVRTLVVQKPLADRIVTLRARTLSTDGPHLRARSVLPDRDAFAAALRDRFGIDPDALGRRRLDRLWTQACVQHVAHRAASSSAPAPAAARAA
jgi:N-hydroxyarylamine O-acetyltransferase